ncbi:MAG: DegV family protein, partial [Lachnospiraceae bacterium]|nr:DegV family protein [Lachnospiraceae bacterium]
GSYSSTKIAASEMEEDNFPHKVVVVDSLCASMGEGLLVHKAVQMKENGATLEETVKWLEENKLHLVHNFTVDDLFHLHRGGRVSKTAAVLGTMINLKPVLHVDDEGHLIMVSKVRGRKKSLITLVDNMEKQMGSYRDQNDIVFISHGDALEDAQFVANLVKERFGIDSFLINYVGSTIGAHSGPGTIALFYMGEYR